MFLNIKFGIRRTKQAFIKSYLNTGKIIFAYTDNEGQINWFLIIRF